MSEVGMKVSECGLVEIANTHYPAEHRVEHQGQKGMCGKDWEAKEGDVCRVSSYLVRALSWAMLKLVVYPLKAKPAGVVRGLLYRGRPARILILEVCQC